MSKTLPEIIDKLQRLGQELKEAHDAMKPLQAKCSKLSGQISRLAEKRDLLKLATRPNPDEIDFDIILPKDGYGQTVANHKERERQLELLHLRASGVWTDTGQGAIQISLLKARSEKTKAVFDGLCVVLPHIVPNDQGMRRIGIFEHTLSQHGSWFLGVLGDNGSSETLLLCNNRENQRFTNLMAALEYCQEYHWYEEK
jgi:hypothetical protein